jgi:hypothetical protein
MESKPRDSVLRSVRDGRFDAGVADLADVLRLQDAGMPIQIVHKFTAPSYVWVSTGRLSPPVIEAIRQRLLAIRDPDVLAALDEVLTGFAPIGAEDLEEIENSLVKAQWFDEL